MIRFLEISCYFCGYDALLICCCMWNVFSDGNDLSLCHLWKNKTNHNKTADMIIIFVICSCEYFSSVQVQLCNAWIIAVRHICLCAHAKYTRTCAVILFVFTRDHFHIFEIYFWVKELCGSVVLGSLSFLLYLSCSHFSSSTLSFWAIYSKRTSLSTFCSSFFFLNIKRP